MPKQEVQSLPGNNLMSFEIFFLILAWLYAGAYTIIVGGMILVFLVASRSYRGAGTFHIGCFGSVTYLISLAYLIAYYVR